MELFRSSSTSSLILPIGLPLLIGLIFSPTYKPTPSRTGDSFTVASQFETESVHLTMFGPR